jgi:hypothetical protein
MWIYLRDAFLSVVVDRNDPNSLLVRGRFPGDIERVLPYAEVIATPRADYRFRASVPRAAVAEMLARQALTMTADNFKGSVKRTGGTTCISMSGRRCERRNNIHSLTEARPATISRRFSSTATAHNHKHRDGDHGL